MNTATEIKKQPNLWITLRTGVATLSKRFHLIFFPFLFDLFLLFGPRVTISSIANRLLNDLALPESTSPELVQTWTMMVESLRGYFAHFNLLSTLRTLPFGMPSLFSLRAFETNPLNQILSWELPQAGQIPFVVLFCFFVGLIPAVAFYQLAANATHPEGQRKFLRQFPRSFSVIFEFQLVSLVVLLVLLLPGTMLVGVLTVLSPFLGTVGYMLLMVFLISLLLPLVFTPHAILTYGLNLREAALLSTRTFRANAFSASFFVMAAAAISYLTNLLWQTPPDSSWMLLVGAFGHAVVSTILVSASFHFFNSAVDFTKFVYDSTQPAQV